MSELSSDISTISSEESSKNVIEFLGFTIDEKVIFIKLKSKKLLLISFCRLWMKLVLEELKISLSG